MLERAQQARLVALGGGRLADDRDAAGPAEVTEVRADLVEQPGADQHRIRTLPADVDADAASRDEPGRDRVRGFLGGGVAVDIERDVRVGVRDAAFAQRRARSVDRRDLLIRTLLHRRGDARRHALERAAEPDDQSELAHALRGCPRGSARHRRCRRRSTPASGGATR